MSNNTFLGDQVVASLSKTHVRATMDAGGSGPNLPVSSTILWYDPSDTDSITDTLGAVSAIDELVTGDNHLIQGTAANQPVTNSRTLNGLNVLDYDGNNDYLLRNPIIGSLSMMGGADILISIVIDPDVNGSGYDGIYDYMALGGSPQNRVYTRLNELVGLTSFDWGSIPVAPAIFTCAVTNALIQTWLDSTSKGSSAYTPQSTEDMLSLSLGQTSLSFEGGVGEVVVYTDASQRAAAVTYLTDKWIP